MLNSEHCNNRLILDDSMSSSLVEIHSIEKNVYEEFENHTVDSLLITLRDEVALYVPPEKRTRTLSILQNLITKTSQSDVLVSPGCISRLVKEKDDLLLEIFALRKENESLKAQLGSDQDPAALVAEAEEKANEMLHHAVEEMQAMLLDAQNESTDIIAHAQKEASRIMTEAELTRLEKVEDAKTEASKLLQEAEQIVANANNYAADIREKIQLEGEEFRRALNEERENTIIEAKSEAGAIIAEAREALEKAHVDASVVEEQAKLTLQNAKDEAASITTEALNLLNQSRSDAATILQDAVDSAEGLISRSTLEVMELKKESEALENRILLSRSTLDELESHIPAKTANLVNNVSSLLASPAGRDILASSSPANMPSPILRRPISNNVSSPSPARTLLFEGHLSSYSSDTPSSSNSSEPAGNVLAPQTPQKTSFESYSVEREPISVQSSFSAESITAAAIAQAHALLSNQSQSNASVADIDNLRSKLERELRATRLQLEQQRKDFEDECRARVEFAAERARAIEAEAMKRAAELEALAKDKEELASRALLKAESAEMAANERLEAARLREATAEKSVSDAMERAVEILGRAKNDRDALIAAAQAAASDMENQAAAVLAKALQKSSDLMLGN